MKRGIVSLGVLLAVGTCSALTIHRSFVNGYPAEVARARQGAVPSPHAFVAKANFVKTNPQPRALIDIPFRADLRLRDGVSFDITVDDASCFGSMVCHFKSGKGWYSAGFDVVESGKPVHVVIHKSKVAIEGDPSGWGNVDTVRVSGWRAGTSPEKVARFTVANLKAEGEPSPYLVLQGLSCSKIWPSEKTSYIELAGRLQDGLRMAGLNSQLLADTELDAKAMEGVKAVFLPYNGSLPEPVGKLLATFVANGGKLYAAYTLNAEILKLLGLKAARYVRAPVGTDLGGFVRTDTGLKGEPPFVAQHSPMAMVPQGVDATNVLATWKQPIEGQTLPALVRVPHGLYLGHVWLGNMSPDGLAFLAALVRELVPSAGAELERALAKRRSEQRAEEKWVKSLPTGPKSEFRAFWCHSARGLGGTNTWDDSIRFLKEHGFNTMMANLAWGLAADYPSDVLPRSKETQGDNFDSFAACQSACRKYGVGFHVWMVCWNAGRGTTRELLKQYEEDGRLQKSFTGEVRPWLCPTDPRNRTLEENALVEIAHRGADGIHFDYIRYPDSNSCFCEGCRERFEAKLGHAVAHWPADVRKDKALAKAWVAFRVEAITTFVRSVSKRVRRETPGVKVSAATFPEVQTTNDTIGQDWTSWCREGLLDFVLPMDYKNSTPAFAALIRAQKKLLGKFALYPGISLTATGAEYAGRARRVAEQIQAVRGAGLRGFCVFNYDAAAEEVLPLLSAGPTAP